MTQPTKVIQKTTCGRAILTKHKILINGVRYWINKDVHKTDIVNKEKQDNRAENAREAKEAVHAKQVSIVRSYFKFAYAFYVTIFVLFFVPINTAL